MILSKWKISLLGHLHRDGVLPSSYRTRIVYIEDHSIFREAVINNCIKPFFKNLHLTEFTNGNDAFEYIKNEINANSKIDLIITDINHPGMSGYKLVDAVHEYEKSTGSDKFIPIIVITMIEETHFMKMRKHKKVDYYLNKTTSPENIIDCIEEVLYAFNDAG